MRALAVALGLCALACAPVEPCAAGETRCRDGVFEGCGPAGFTALETCEAACDDRRGCVVCTIDEVGCVGDVARRCRADGRGWEEERCDPETGTTCDPDFGCVGPCALGSLGRSYIGCEYYPVVLGNPVPEEFSFAVVVANSGGVATQVSIEGGALTGTDRFEVPAGGAVVRRLPWQRALKLCSGPTFMEECDPSLTEDVLARGGAYHLRADHPVVVYQFNPLEYQLTGPETHYSYSADASLLLPTNAWGRRYLAVSERGFARWPGEVVIVAREPTEVTVTPTASTASLPAGAARTFMLDAGDALELLAPFEDLTGTLIEGDRPLSVLSGHFATNVPTAFDAADHLEDSMLPIEALGTRYVVVPTAPAIERLADAGQAVVRVVLADDAADLTLDPPIPGVRTHLSGIGDAITIGAIAAPVEIRSTGRVLVAQELVGGAAYGPFTDEVPLAGDPALGTAVPVEQYRTEYLVHAPPSYEASFVAIVAPASATVSLDGVGLSGETTPVGTTELALRTVRLPSEGDGNHRLTGTAPFGVLVYGYGAWTSYLYPGGLDLNVLEPE